MYSSTLPSTSALDGGGWSTPRTGRYPRERPGTHCIGGWVGTRAGLDGCRKPRPHRNSIPGPSIQQRVAIPTELCRPRCLSQNFNLLNIYHFKQNTNHTKLCLSYPLSVPLVIQLLLCYAYFAFVFKLLKTLKLCSGSCKQWMRPIFSHT